MKIIPVSQIYGTLVDDSDYEYLSQFSWYYAKGYAIRRDPVSGKTICMHRELLNAPTGLDVDHINGARMDNRRSNLRIVTRQQNNWNQGKRHGTSIYKGVSWHTTTKQWRVCIRYKGKKVSIGTFRQERHAALAYDLWARETFGEYAKTNFLILN
jgi:hypothetical protein